MKTFRRILTGAALTALVAGLASADTIIAFTQNSAATPTDITNLQVALPSWDPGGSTTLDTTLTSSPLNHGYTGGVSMASLNNPALNYILLGYDIQVSEFISGSYSITNTSPTSTATGSAFVDTYNAVSLNAPLAPPLGNTVDPSNDLFRYSVTGIGTNPPLGPPGAPGEQTTSIAGGPDPSGGLASNFTILPGQSSGAVAVSTDSPTVDLGAELIANLNGDCASVDTNPSQWAVDCTDAHIYSALANGYFIPALGVGPNVNSLADLVFYLSTITQTDQQVTGGNLTSTYNLSVQDQVTVTYDYTTRVAGSPEPASMALMGGALIGLGLLRKRFKKS